MLPFYQDKKKHVFRYAQKRQKTDQKSTPFSGDAFFIIQLIYGFRKNIFIFFRSLYLTQHVLYDKSNATYVV